MIVFTLIHGVEVMIKEDIPQIETIYEIIDNVGGKIHTIRLQKIKNVF